MKRALPLLGVLAGVLVLGALLAWNSLDLVVRVALERWGPEVTGVEIDVGEIEISPRDGRGRIGDLEVGNPAGFSSGRAARFGEVRLGIDPSTITSDVVHVRELSIVASQINYERDGRGTNLDAIQRSIEAYVKRSQEAEASGAASGTKRRFVIDRLSIRNTRVVIVGKGTPGGQGLSLDLPDMDLRDIGKKQGGLTVSQVAVVVAATLQQRIAIRLLSNLETLRRGGLEGAIDALRNLVK